MAKSGKKAIIPGARHIRRIVRTPAGAVYETTRKLRDEVRKNVGNAIVAAFAFIIALVWRDVIQEGVNKMIADFGIVGNEYSVRIMAALLATIICVAGILYFSKWSEKPVEKK